MPKINDFADRQSANLHLLRRKVSGYRRRGRSALEVWRIGVGHLPAEPKQVGRHRQHEADNFRGVFEIRAKRIPRRQRIQYCKSYVEGCESLVLRVLQYKSGGNEFAAALFV